MASIAVTTPADPKIPWLPPELWREILREVGAISDEFEVYFASYWHHLRIRYSGYCSLWRVAIRNRYHVIRVSRLWHSLGVDFLHSSFLINTRKDFLRLLNLVQSPTIARRLKRVTLTPPNPRKSGPYDPIFFRGLDVCPNLTISVNFHWLAPFPQVDQLVLNARLTRLEIESHGEATAFRAFVASLSGCTSLRSLRLQFNPKPELSNLAPVSLPHLEELDLHLTNYPNVRDIMIGWLPLLVLPKLTALILSGEFTEVTPALQKFGTQLHTLGLEWLPMDPCSPHAIPTLNLRRVLVKHHAFRSKWHHLPQIVNMENVEVLGVQVIDSMNPELLRAHGGSPFDKPSALLRLVTDSQTMPSLSRVTLHLRYNRSSDIWPMIEVHVLRWAQKIQIRRPGLQVYLETYDKDCHTPRCTPLFPLFGLS